MSEDVKLEVIKNTQDSLSKYIKKPPLTEKLLRKPPFRYLHDITTAVMRETGYLQGLYTQDELNPENIKDRDAKIAFLEKLIAAVNLSTGVTISARPNKIVAGLDVAKTNELLQTIGKALEKNVDSSQAVEQILSNKKGLNQQTSSKKEISKTKPNKEGKRSEPKAKEPKTNEVVKKIPKDSKSKNVIKPEPKKEKRPSKEALIKNDPAVEDDIVVENNNGELQKDIINQAVVTQPSTEATTQEYVPQQPPVSPKHEDRNANATVQVQSSAKSDDAKPLEEDLKRPQSARAVHRKKAATRKPNSEAESNNKDDASIVKEVATDPKPPPSDKLSSQHASSEAKEVKRPRTAARPASARPGAPRVRDRGTIQLSHKDKVVSEPVNVIEDSQELPKDDDDTVVKVEASTTLTDTAVVDQVVNESDQLTGDQGHLVSQILETQKELEDPTSGLDTSSHLDIKKDRPVGRESTGKEVEKLQAAIQALTQAANPLGKLIDFLQEDVDSMQTELEMWISTNGDLSKQLQAEEQLTEQCIEPLARQLEDITHLIEEQLEETSVVKAAIIRNDDRILRLLQSSSSHRPS